MTARNSQERGPAAQMAMRIIVRMAEICGADSLMDITGAHIDSALFQGDATLEFAERLAGLGAKVVVPTTLNVSGVDEHGWREWATPPEWAEKARRQMVAYQSLWARRRPGLARLTRPSGNRNSGNRLRGGIERDLLCKLSHRRAHRTLSRSDGHLRGHHRASSCRRIAPDRKSRGPDSDETRGCSATRAGRR